MERYKTFSIAINAETDFLDSIEDKDDLMRIFDDFDKNVYKSKWYLAKMWMFGVTDDLTDEEQLAAAGLI